MNKLMKREVEKMLLEDERNQVLEHIASLERPAGDASPNGLSGLGRRSDDEGGGGRRTRVGSVTRASMPPIALSHSQGAGSDVWEEDEDYDTVTACPSIWRGGGGGIAGMQAGYSRPSTRTRGMGAAAGRLSEGVEGEEEARDSIV